MTLGEFLQVFVSRGDVGINVELLWVYVGPFSKNTHFPNCDCTKRSGYFWTTLGSLWC